MRTLRDAIGPNDLESVINVLIEAAPDILNDALRDFTNVRVDCLPQLREMPEPQRKALLDLVGDAEVYFLENSP